MDSSGKRPRVETVSNLPAYPQRPGERYCDNYMLTRTCKFGERCIFDHPLWVSEGGIQDYNEVPCNYPSVLFYERCRDRDCPCYTTKSFSFGLELNQPMVSFTPAQVHYSTELPIRPGKEDCLGYINNGSCMYGTNCQFNHPKTIHVPSAAALPNAMIKSALPFGKYNNHFTDEVFNLPSSDLQNMDLHSAIASLEEEQAIHPQRPGEINCNLYMKTGRCMFGERCEFQHPIDWLPPRAVTANQAVWPNVKHSIAVLPRREGTVVCDYYMNTGVCMFGFACQFDHPPPREVLAMGRAQEGAAGSVTETQKAQFVWQGTAACDHYMNTGICEFRFACKFYHPPPREVLATARAQEGAAGCVTETEAASSIAEEQEDEQY